MKLLLTQFKQYFFIGILNTLVHWGIFYILYTITTLQSFSNLVGFFTAVVFSFFMNAKLTFKAHTTSTKLLSYTTFMGGLSYLIGAVADHLQIAPILTLIIFSGSSLIFGFLYAKFIVFKHKH